MTGARIREALKICVTAPVASFRDPLYAGVQAGLPCPPPSTVGGLLAAAAGGWPALDEGMCFAMAFEARGVGVDVETYHPLDKTGARTDPRPVDRDFLAGVSLTVWLIDDIETWTTRMRRPVWPLRLGRSQDLVGVRTFPTTLSRGTGRQGRALVPATMSNAGMLLRLPTAISLGRHRTVWEGFRYRAGTTPGSDQSINDVWTDVTGQAVVLLPPTHPAHAEHAAA